MPSRTMGGLAPRPKKIRIGPFTWTVAWTLNHPTEMGLTDYKALTISVDGDYPEQILRETLLHELMHACHVTLGVMNAEDDITSERFIGLVSPLLYATLSQNKDLNNYLFGGSGG